MGGILYFICTLLSLGEWDLVKLSLSFLGPLRQEDPLSPFFFIIMEASSKMILALVDGGLLSGIMVGSRSGGAINISHLLFVDDT